MAEQESMKKEEFYLLNHIIKKNMSKFFLYLCFFTFITAQLFADQNDKRLNILFDKLIVTENQQEIKKLTNQIDIESIEIEDKSFLHKNHAGNQEGRYHLKIILSSSKLKNLSRIESNKKIYKILDHELKNYIHSIQILIS